ncbi:MAG TPA: O-antigen ligase family protein [Bryobacteraceae bacterium]|nr:O-antigen ligase family protein [Bryobacteraceae bacterium]
MNILYVAHRAFSRRIIAFQATTYVAFGKALAALFFFAILTLWIPAYWPITVFQVGVYTLAGIAVWRSRNTGLPFRWPIVCLSYPVFWGLLQWFTAQTAYAYQTRLAILKWATFLSVYVAGMVFFRDREARRWFRSAMVWFGLGVAILATLQSFTSHGMVFWIFATPYSDYVMGPMVSRNDFAVFIEIVLPIALYQAVTREPDTLLYSGISAVMYACVIASASRAGTTLATAEMILVPLLLWGRHRAARTALLRVGVLVVVLAAVVGVGPLWNRLMEPDPMSGRREFAQSTWRMAREHPWMGVGLGNWPTVYPSYALIDLGGPVNQAHDDWLQWAAEGGFPFGVIMATLFIWCVRPAFRSVWGIGLVAVCLHALVDYPFARPALGSWPVLIMAMLPVGEPRASVRDVPGRRGYTSV